MLILKTFKMEEGAKHISKKEVDVWSARSGF
jgi:hypothetical protein